MFFKAVFLVAFLLALPAVEPRFRFMNYARTATVNPLPSPTAVRPPLDREKEKQYIIDSIETIKAKFDKNLAILESVHKNLSTNVFYTLGFEIGKSRQINKQHQIEMSTLLNDIEHNDDSWSFSTVKNIRDEFKRMADIVKKTLNNINKYKSLLKQYLIEPVFEKAPFTALYYDEGAVAVDS